MSDQGHTSDQLGVPRNACVLTALTELNWEMLFCAPRFWIHGAVHASVPCDGFTTTSCSQGTQPIVGLRLCNHA